MHVWANIVYIRYVCVLTCVCMCPCVYACLRVGVCTFACVCVPFTSACPAAIFAFVSPMDFSVVGNNLSALSANYIHINI